MQLEKENKQEQEKWQKKKSFLELMICNNDEEKDPQYSIISENELELDSLATGLMKCHHINFFIFLRAVHIHIPLYTQMLNITLQSLSLKIISYNFIVL